MATKKATTKPTTGKNMVNWEERFAEAATEATKMEASAGAGGTFISTRGGILSYNDADIPGNKMNVVVIDHVLENHYYGDKAYDPENPASPVCFSFNRDEGEMVPHEQSLEPQSDACATCPRNEWGSADLGKGKACKNIRRLAIITEDELEDAASAKVVFLKLPVTSVKAWTGYVRQLQSTLNRPPFGVVTEVSLVRDAKTQFKVQFKLVDKITDPTVINELFEKNKATRDIIEFPYKQYEEEEAPSKAPARKAGVVKKTVPAKKAPSPPAKATRTGAKKY